MKKIFLLVLIVLSFILTGCTSNVLSNISIDEVKEKMNNKESFIIYFTDKDSELLETNLKEVLAENNLKGFKVDISKINSDEENNFRLLIDYTNPSIVFIKDGIDPSILSHIKNDATKKDITQKLIDMNFIVKNS